jgi:hypothetical protein
VAKAVIQAVKQQSPPGRFLTGCGNKWQSISHQKALEKTSQALRERDGTKKLSSIEALEATSIAGDDRLTVLTEVVKANGPGKKKKSTKKRKINAFEKPSWWSKGTPVDTNKVTPQSIPSFDSNSNSSRTKRTKKSTPNTTTDDTDTPLPLDSLQARQTSFFDFLSKSIFFGKNKQPNDQNLQSNRSSFGSIANPIEITSMDSLPQYPTQTITASSAHNNLAMYPIQQQHMMTSLNGRASLVNHNQQQVDDFEPLPFEKCHTTAFSQNENLLNEKIALDQVQILQQMQSLKQQQQEIDILVEKSTKRPSMPPPSTSPLYPQQQQQQRQETSLPKNGLKAQVSDWLTSLFPPQPEEADPPPQQEQQEPALDRDMSPTLMNLVRSPSTFLTTLKSGVTSLFLDTSSTTTAAQPPSDYEIPPPLPPPAMGQNTSFGTRSSARDSLLDDTEDDPFETQLRNFHS